MVFGILIAGLMVAGGSASAIDGGAAPAAGNTAPASPGKHTTGTKLKKQRPLPLATALGGVRTTEAPLASIQAKQPPPSQPSWTGTYVGIGAGPTN